MGLPYKLKNFTAFGDGTNFMGEIAEVALPKIAHKLEQWRGGGMLGEIDVSMGLEKLEMGLKFGGLPREIFRQFGKPGVSGNLIRYVGAYQEDGSGGVKQAELVATGLYTEIDPGTAKVGEGGEWDVKATLTYLKWTVSGRTEVEIDMLTGLLITGGVDRTAALRAALGQ